jgi:GNAT superfamily N-acetyltransferase
MNTAAAAIWFRSHEPGDIGWVISRHGALYAQEYGWDSSFEALVAEVAAKFLRERDPRQDTCIIAMHGEKPTGCAFVVRHADTVAQLRLVLVEPDARGHGIGRMLVARCIQFARDAGYRSMMLWTNDILHAARRLYVEAGFVLVSENAHHSFGKDLVGQNWELHFK